MFHIEQVANKDYFCCPQGYIGVLPQAGAGGICQVEGVNVPKSQLATMASQIGGTSVAASGTPVPTVATSKSSATTTGQGQGTTSQNQGIATQTSQGTTQTSVPGGEPTSGTSSSPLSTGAIAGIAVGAAAFLLVFALVLWLHRRSLKKQSQTVHGAPTESFNQDFKGIGETQAKQIGAQSNTPSSGLGYSAHGASEVDANSRAEMEAPVDRG